MTFLFLRFFEVFVSKEFLMGLTLMYWLTERNFYALVVFLFFVAQICWDEALKQIG